MDEYLTIDEIEARYAPDWVLIAEPRTDEGQQLLGGRVVGRAGNHVDLLWKARELDLHHLALRKLGPWPADMELVL